MPDQPQQAPQAQPQAQEAPQSQPSSHDGIDAALAAQVQQIEAQESAARREAAQAQLRATGEEEAEAAPEAKEAPKPEPAPEEKEAPAPDAKGPKPSAWASFKHQQQQFVKSQQAFAAEKEAVLGQIREWESLKARAKDDPFTALRHLGWEDGKEFINQIAETGGKMSPEQKRLHDAETQIANLRKEREEAQAQAQALQQQRETQQQVDSYHAHIAKYIKDTPEFAESIVASPGTEQHVLNLMRQHYEQTNEELPIREAVKQVEASATDQVGALLQELAGTKRGLAMINELASKLNKPALASQRAPSGITQRISNNTGSVEAQKKPRTLDDEIAAAAARMNAQFG